MKKINCITLMFILFLSVLLVRADEDGEEYEINPPDITDLRLPYYTTISKVYGVRPEYWDVRAIAMNNYVLEFDKQANVLSVNGKKQLADGSSVTGHLVELYSKFDNRPVWKGWPSIYYWVDPSKLSNAFTIVTNEALIRSTEICPAQVISGGYTLDIGYSNDDTQQFLNGDCHKAIDKKINGRIYKTYPPSKKIDKSDETYWTVQYFNDPITPLYDITGKCVLYCNTKETK